MKCALTWKLSLTLGGILLVLGAVGVFVYRSTTRLAENARWTAHVHRIVGLVEALNRDLDQAAADRCTFLTEPDRQPPLVHETRKQIAQHFQQLRTLTEGNANQQLQLDAAERLSEDVLSVLDRSVRLCHDQGFNARTQSALTREYEQGRTALRRVFAEIGDEENSLLDAWDRQSRAAASDTLCLIDAGNVLTVTIAGLGAVTIRRELRRHRWEAERALARQEETSARLEQQSECCRLLEEQVRRSQKLSLLGRLVGGVVHDCNNLISVVLNAGEIALNKLRADDPVRDLVHLIVQAAERMALLSRQLLAFSRGRATTPTRLCLNQVVTEMANVARCLLGRSVEWEALLAADLPDVEADRLQLEQVLLNLVANARDAMPQGGRLLVQTATVRGEEVPEAGACESWVRLAVSDTGCGMDEATRAHLFEPFFTTKEDGKGTGLGMGIVQDVIRQSGGRLRVDSAPGQGTTVTIFLPVAAESAPIPTVLFVGADELGEEPVQRLSQQSGYKLLRAPSAEDAVRLSEGHSGPIDLLVADLRLVQKAGPDLTRRLTALHPKMQVLYLADGEEVHVRLDPAPADSPVLPRPFTLEALGQKLRELLRH